MKPVFGHVDDQENGKQQEDRARRDEGDGQIDAGEQHADHDPGDGGDLLDLRAAHVDRPDAIRAHFVGDPRFGCAADEGCTNAADNFRREHHSESWDESLDKVGSPGQQNAEDHREAAAVKVGDDAGGNFEQENGGLKDRAEQDDLKRVQPDGLGVKDDVNRHHDAEKQRRDAFQQQVDQHRVEAAARLVIHTVSLHTCSGADQAIRSEARLKTASAQLTHQLG